MLLFSQFNALVRVVLARRGLLGLQSRGHVLEDVYWRLEYVVLSLVSLQVDPFQLLRP